MNPLMFPKMLVSPHEGWDWLMRVHPSVPRLFVGFVVPMSLIPPAMLLYAWHAYGVGRLPEITPTRAYLVAAVLYVVQLIVVPVMGAVVQRIGAVIDAHPTYQDAFTFAAVVPTPIWLAPLCLFVPSLLLNALAMLLALIGAGMMIFEGVYRVFRVEDDGHAMLVAGSVLAAGLVAWVAMVGLVFVSSGLLLT